MLNPLKHHLGYIRALVEQLAADMRVTEEVLAAVLLPIGESQMDVYTGSLMPSTLADEIIRWLKQSGRYEAQDYTHWLHGEPGKFATLPVSDGSVWVLRLGDQPERYVHLHPGRYSPRTFRVRAGVLKIALAAAVCAGKDGVPVIDLSYLNSVRKRVFGASPVKAITATEGVGKMIDLLSGRR